MIQLEYQNIKIFFAKGNTPSWSEEAFVIKKIKKTVSWKYVFNDLNGEEIAETFCKKNREKTSQKEFRIEKVIKRKGDKLYITWKGYDSPFNSWRNKKDIVWMSENFPKPNSLRVNVKIELDLSNYATKSDFKKKEQKLTRHLLLKRLI